MMDILRSFFESLYFTTIGLVVFIWILYLNEMVRRHIYVAVGIDDCGDKHKFRIYDKKIYCECGNLVTLKVPYGIKTVFCHDNQLTELNLPRGVETVYCHDNQITHIELPDSVTYLACDKEVIGLERYIGKVKMHLV